MRGRPLALLACLFLTSSACAAGPQVVELFQSQGCSSCPPANAVLSEIADRPDVLALNFAVTYWDKLGWKDSFAQPGFTRRQWDYARSGGRANVFTPQMIVNGRGVLVGGNRPQVEDAIRRYARKEAGPMIDADRGGVTIGRGAARGPATIWLVRYDPREQRVPIRAGENSGRTLPHRNIVRELTALGTWTGQPIHFGFTPARDRALRSAILLQQGNGGAVIGAAQIG